MKIRILLIIFGLLLNTTAFSESTCFLAKEKNHVLKQEGSDCVTPYPPQSTFKIALSLMGFDAGIFKDETHPSWKLPKGQDSYINICKTDHTPHSWIRDSCAWYTKILTHKLGMKKLQDYVNKFSYGNMDLSGNEGKNNELDQAWITSSLKISPIEQTEFLQKVIDCKLPVSKTSYDKTKNIIFTQELPGGWKLYGKTGYGMQKDQNGNKTESGQGWFVGYIEKGARAITFASHITDDKKQDTFTSLRARNEALTKLFYLINELE